MKNRPFRPLAPLFLLGALAASGPEALADSSHARIIRVSYVQGDVRFLRESGGDPLTDSRAVWEKAALNLPLRQGNVLATDQGRAEVEFENGTLAFLSEQTVLEFYDLSIQDGAFATRLILRQGSASFHTSLGGEDYFSVTGGDFTIEARGKSGFRIDSFDDGSTVESFEGSVNLLRNKVSTRLDKGHSFSVKAGEDSAPSTGPAPAPDDFDHWVSERVESVATSTGQTLQYTSSPYYAAGFGTLSSYGGWSSCGGFGYGWRPFGAGLAWSPFSGGQWFWDPAYGWTFLASQPWGWAPYHYGGWLFDSSCGGWLYFPPPSFNNPPTRFGPRKPSPRPVHPPRPVYQPATALFLKQGGKLGLVPKHPLDQPGKPPKNLERGVFSISAQPAGESLLSADPGKRWTALKSAPRSASWGTPTRVDPPVRFSRTLAGRSAGNGSSIVYDARDHRFVNGSSGAGEPAGEKSPPAQSPVANPDRANGSPGARSGPPAAPPSAVASTLKTPGAPAPPRAIPPVRTPPPARGAIPPPAPRSSGGSRTGGGSSAAPSPGRAGSGSAPPPSAPSHASGGASHPSSGRPH